MRVRRSLWAVVAGLLLVPLLPVVARSALVEGPAKLDPELVRQLGAAKAGQELLVFVHGRDVDRAKAAVRTGGLQLVDTFDRIGVAVAAGVPDRIDSLAGADGVTYLEANAPVELLLDTSHEATRGEELYRGFTVQTEETSETCKGQSEGKGKGKGKNCETTTTTVDKKISADGSGVSIAVIDSGIDGTHPMFQQEGESNVIRNMKLACVQQFVFPGVLIGDEDESHGMPPSSCPSSYELGDDPWIDVAAAGNDTDTPSAGGHGTHVAGIAAGVDVTTGDGRALHGAAPGAKLVGLGIGTSLTVHGGASAMNWVLQNHAEPCGRPPFPPLPSTEGADPCPPIRVINNSWGRGGEFDSNSALGKLTDALIAEGVVVVWAAGNGDGDGSDNSVTRYAQNPAPGLLNVANYDDGGSGNRDGSLDDSSSRGERGRPETYPDVSAPGAFITSACRVTLTVCSTGADFADPNYNTISGTSMATPHVTGIVAQLLQLKPDATPADIEDALEDTAHQFGDPNSYEQDVESEAAGGDVRNADHTTSFDKGHGLVDVVAAASRLLSVAGPPPPPQCSPGGPLIADVEGDAVGIGARLPVPSEPSLDIVDVVASWDDAAGALTFQIHVSDLAEANPKGSPSIFFGLDFRTGSDPHSITARRHVVLGESFTFSGAPMEGSFDPVNDVITVTLPEGALAGNVLSAFTAESRYDSGVIIAPLADTAGGPCTFAVPGEAPPLPMLSPEDPEHMWSGGPTTNASLLFGCSGVRGEACDEERIDVTVPAGGGILEVSMTADLSFANDYDLVVFDPEGNQLGDEFEGENFGSDETVDAPITLSGIYMVVVRAFNTVEAKYQASAKLLPAP